MAEFNPGEAFEEMRRRQEKLRLNDHVPLSEIALGHAVISDGLWIGLFSAALVAVLAVIGAVMSIYGWHVVTGGW